MGLQKYRADSAGEKYSNGAIPYYAKWIGGPSLALIRDCPTVFGPRTVYVTGEACTYSTLPAACTFKGRTVRGWLSFSTEGAVFHASKYSWVYPHIDPKD